MSSDPFNYLWNGVLTVGTMIMGVYLKSQGDSVKEHRDLIARTREEVREKYVHKNEMQVVVESLNSRFDRIEEKIDRIIGSN